MAIWMVKQNLDGRGVLEKARELTFPASVVDYMRGGLGQPPGGFPEPLRANVLKGTAPIEGRPGSSLPPLDWAAAKAPIRSRAASIRAPLMR